MYFPPRRITTLVYLRPHSFSTGLVKMIQLILLARCSFSELLCSDTDMEVTSNGSQEKPVAGDAAATDPDGYYEWRFVFLDLHGQRPM